MIAEVSTLSPAQLSILDMMSFVKTPTAIDEQKSVLSDYFANRLSEEIDKMWEKATCLRLKQKVSAIFTNKGHVLNACAYSLVELAKLE